MRFLVVGLGSMGKRRIRNLAHLEAGDLAGFDPREDRRSEAAGKYGVPVYGDFEAAMGSFRPEALVISTPPDLHVRYARTALERGCHFFAEASVLDDGMEELHRLSRARPELVAAPSCTMRYHPSVRRIRELVAGGAVGSPRLLTYQCGQWLPDWHPWEDYRAFYVSRRATGACREIVPFELSWLTWALGPVESVAAMRGKLSTLDCDIDDAYQLLLRFRSGMLGHLLVDVIARAPVRSLRICGEGGTIEWDAAGRRVRRYDASAAAWRTIEEPARIEEPGYVNAENMYIDEMRDFAEACAGGRPWGYTLEEDMRTLSLLKAAETASDEGRTVRAE